MVHELSIGQPPSGAACTKQRRKISNQQSAIPHPLRFEQCSNDFQCHPNDFLRHLNDFGQCSNDFGQRSNDFGWRSNDFPRHLYEFLRRSNDSGRRSQCRERTKNWAIHDG